MNAVPTPAPDEGGSYARLAMREAFSVAVDELDRFMSRLCRHDPRLVLEPEGDMWIIVDVANNDVVMFRSPRRLSAVKFARAFVIQTEGATLDEVSITRSGGGSPGDDGGVGAPPDSRSAGEPKAGAPGDALSQPGPVSQGGQSDPASPADNVVPLFRSHAEEIAAVVAGVHPGQSA